MPTYYSILCPSRPHEGLEHTGKFVIPQGERWYVRDAKGVTTAFDGPTIVTVFGATLTRARCLTANEQEYLELRYLDGHSDVVPGPASVYEDTLVHQRIHVLPALSINTNEAIVVYREQELKGSKEVVREIVKGPTLYKPKSASEWRHRFSWHGHDPSGDREQLSRKRPHALKFEKLLLAPSSTYYDVENVRTADDALLTVRLMVFYQLRSVEQMLDTTNDPIADIVNSVSSDVISFCSARSFEQFKEQAEQLNSLGVFQNLVGTVGGRGLAVSKVVFRGFIAPGRLQKMHDDAIERRTRLVLERESEVQEQRLKDERMSKEAERAVVARGMEVAQAEHRAAMARSQFEATQRERAEEADSALAASRAKEGAELAHLAALKAQLDLSGTDVAALLVARAHTPAKLIQITGDAKPVVHVDPSK